MSQFEVSFSSRSHRIHLGLASSTQIELDPSQRNVPSKSARIAALSQQTRQSALLVSRQMRANRAGRVQVAQFTMRDASSLGHEAASGVEHIDLSSSLHDIPPPDSRSAPEASSEKSSRRQQEIVIISNSSSSSSSINSSQKSDERQQDRHCIKHSIIPI